MPEENKTVVLVADDEPSTLALVSGHLRSRGYKVIEATDGDQAWELAYEHLPHVVVLDVMMPGMSGWEVCRKIREAVSLAHTGVVMLTGIGENLNEMTSPLYGADAYIDKPFDFRELDAKIRETLSSRRGGTLGRPDDADKQAADDEQPSMSNGASTFEAALGAEDAAPEETAEAPAEPERQRAARPRARAARPKAKAKAKTKAKSAKASNKARSSRARPARAAKSAKRSAKSRSAKRGAKRAKKAPARAGKKAAAKTRGRANAKKTRGAAKSKAARSKAARSKPKAQSQPRSASKSRPGTRRAAAKAGARRAPAKPAKPSRSAPGNAKPRRATRAAPSEIKAN